MSPSGRGAAFVVVAGAVGFCLSGVSDAFVPAVPRGLPSSSVAATERATAPLGARSSRRNCLRQRHMLPLRSADDDKSFEPGQWEPSENSDGEKEDKGKSFEPGQWDPSEAAAKASAGTEPVTGGASAEAAAEAGGGKDMGDPATRSKLKTELVRKVATLNRGFVAQEADRTDIEEIIEMLELENPNSAPCAGVKSQSSPVAGRWQLLYTTSLDVLALQINPTVTIGQIYQDIDADLSGIKNIIELQPPFAAVSNKILGSSLATLTVILDSQPVSDTRLDLTFKRTEIKAQSFFGRELDLPTLGVDIPSGDRLQKFLSKGKKRVEGAKKKAQDMAKKAKNKADDATDGKASEKAQEVATEAKEIANELKDKVDDATNGKGTDVLEDSGMSSTMKPYFETTYVDEDLRVGRTGQGDLYVSTRVL